MWTLRPCIEFPLQNRSAFEIFNLTGVFVLKEGRGEAGIQIPHLNIVRLDFIVVRLDS